MSKEHYISAGLLRLLQGNKPGIDIAGLPWQPPGTLMTMTVKSLQARILCTIHNNGLSSLDGAGIALWSAIDAIDKRPTTAPQLTRIPGGMVERWLLKVLAGLTAAKGEPVPEEWKPLLVGKAWPDTWGLYLVPHEGERIFGREFFVETKVHPDTRRILASRFSMAGALFWLLLGRPDSPSAWGLHRPRGMIFDLEDGSERRIEFLWPFVTDQAAIFTRMGSTSASPPHWADWTKHEA